jgi:HD-GYP domain-containing protein (c-di-GMP phosphodiesterase class II)
MANAWQILEQNTLALTVVPIQIRELFFLDKAACDIYLQENAQYTLLLKKNSFVNKNVLKELITNHQTQLFVKTNERRLVKEAQQENLREITRSLSMGDGLENGRKQMGLLTVNLGYLYEDPNDDSTLNLQYQSLRNLCSFLLNNPDLWRQLYLDYLKQKHHYVLSQPMIAAFFLLGIIKNTHALNDRDIETLFITSYLKDIGMSSIPIEKFLLEDLSEHEKQILAGHARQSVRILKGRLPLGPAYLQIVANHHMFSHLGIEKYQQPQEDEDDQLNETVLGFETMMVSVTDIVAAMISKRPYRSEKKVKESLELIKLLIADQYPQEFKGIVLYFKNLFSA